MPPSSEPRTIALPRGLSWLYVIGGLIGLVASATLLIEKIELFKNPDYVPSCNISPILSCGSVMVTEQAAAFGFPNPILGVIGFAAVLTIGFSGLAGAAYARWMWLAMVAGTAVGVVFVHWLIWQSLYEIGALCPYCMVVWAVTIPLFTFTALNALVALNGEQSTRLLLLREYGIPVVTAWYLVILTMIAIRFWDYWSTLV